MPPEDRGRLGDPVTWLRWAHEDLALAEAEIPGVGFGPLCFHAQQAAEKAIKAVLIASGSPFPNFHDLGRLLQIAGASGIQIPSDVAEADLLSDFASLARDYPGTSELEEADHLRAVATARAVLAWAEEQLRR